MIVLSRFSLFLIHLWIGSISCAVYHIVPSPSHDCPVESCLTLSSFAANVSLYLDNSTSLMFQPGNHTVQSTLNITNVAEFSMTSYSANQSRLHVICETPLPSFFMFEAVGRIYISNLNFFGCEQKILEIDFVEFKSILIETIASSLILQGCIFENNEGSVTVISAEYSNITVAQTTFSNNTYSSILSYRFCNFKLANSTFISNKGLLINSIILHGRDVADLSNTLLFIGCEFKDNYNGLGSIVVALNSDISIINTRFSNNRASPSLYIFNSIVSIDKSVFEHNYGSAITFRDCTVNIFDSVYDSNQGRVDGFGGAITSKDSVIHIHSNEFKKKYC